MLVNANFFNKAKLNVLIILLEYTNLFQSEWQHETNIWEGLPCPLPFYIAVFHFKHSYCNQLSIFCLNLLLLCQHFALCFCLHYSNNFAGIPNYLSLKIVHVSQLLQCSCMWNYMEQIQLSAPEKIPSNTYIKMFLETKLLLPMFAWNNMLCKVQNLQM